MQGKYDELISKVSTAVADSFLEQEGNLVERALHVDGDVAEIVREVGRQVTEQVLSVTADGVAEEASAEGLKVEHRKSTPFLPSLD